MPLVTRDANFLNTDGLRVISANPEVMALQTPPGGKVPWTWICSVDADSDPLAARALGKLDAVVGVASSAAGVARRQQSCSTQPCVMRHAAWARIDLSTITRGSE
jgi:hypothetical protein